MDAPYNDSRETHLLEYKLCLTDIVTEAGGDYNSCFTPHIPEAGAPPVFLPLLQAALLYPLCNEMGGSAQMDNTAAI